MNNLREETISTKRLFTGKMINLRVDEVQLPNGKPATREVIEHPGAVAIVPILPDGRIIMVRQFRYPIGDSILEIPAGKLDGAECPKSCAARELEEETGYISEGLHHVTAIWTAPGFTNEIIHVFLADKLVKKKQKLDEDEFLQIEIYTRDEIRTMIRNGAICDAKSLVGLCLAGI